VTRLLEGTTPGPWRISTDENGYSSIRTGERNSAPDSDLIVDAFCSDEDTHLIAASPSIARAYVALAERVGVLEEALETVMLNNRTGAVGQIAREGWAKARAALTPKASGDEQEKG
jgi:hypothetical protein